MFRFKFQQNRILNEEFVFWKKQGGGGGKVTPNHKFESQFSLVN